MVRIEFDIDMPENCQYCRFSKHPLGQLAMDKYWVCCFVGNVGYGLKRHKDCPLKEVHSVGKD